MSIDQAFDASVEHYDDWVKTALPNYDELFSVSKELIPFETEARIDVLDLGAGTGLFSQHILQKYPCASFVLYDVAVKMLGVARRRFRDHADQFRFVEDDILNLNSVGRFDLAISSLSIHHLADHHKKELFWMIYTALRSPGVFINVDQIKGPTPQMQELYWSRWLDMVRRRGAAEERVQESIQRRLAFDKDALMADQLRWLRETGFASADCVYKNYFVGVFFATKP